jgi:hypothetical protein
MVDGQNPNFRNLGRATPGFQKKSPGLPPIPGKATPEDIRAIAKDVVRSEIVAMSKNLALTIKQTIEKTLEPFNKRFAYLYQEVNNQAVIQNSLIEVLIQKGVFTKEEVEKQVEVNSNAARERYEKLAAEKKAAMEKTKQAVEQAAEQAEVEPPTNGQADPVPVSEPAPEVAAQGSDEIAPPGDVPIPEGPPSLETKSE